MSSHPEFDIDHVARLARLALTAEEKGRFAEQLGEVLAHVAQLRTVNVDGVEPLAHAFPVVNVWQEDRAQDGLPAATALRNAPAQRAQMFVVPKVVE